MKQFFDWLILLLYCTVSLLIATIDIAFVASLLIAIIYASINYFINSRTGCIFTTLLFLLLSCFISDIPLFFPLLFYDVLAHKLYFLLPLPAIFSLWNISHNSYSFGIFLIFGILFSIFLQWQTGSYHALKKKYNQTRDDSVERTLLLKQKNEALIEKQDSEIYAATLKERTRIARDIHDNVGHMLSRSILLVGALKTTNKEPSLAEPFTQLEETLHTAMTNIRESVHDLHDHSIDLQSALNSLIASFTFCPAYMDYDMGYEVPRSVKYTFITIVKEALNNIIKHSNADTVHIVAREHPGLYQLFVEDNGTIPTSFAEGSSSGLGLLNMEDRIRSLDGTLQIQQTDGFRIFITIPKKETLS